MIREIPITGHAGLGPKFEAFAAKLPPAARERLRAMVDTPRAKSFVEFYAHARRAQAAVNAKLDRAPIEMARAKAYAKAQGEEREAAENTLRMTLGKSHGLLLRLNALKRG